MSDEKALRLVVPGSVDYLDRIRVFVEQAADGYGFDETVVDEIVLALDEAVANVVEHAYQDSSLPPAAQTIELEIRASKDSLQFYLRDHGHPFDPRTMREPDLETHLASGKKDGLGIYLMRRLMDRISWRHLADGNELILEKNRAPCPKSPRYR